MEVLHVFKLKAQQPCILSVGCKGQDSKGREGSVCASRFLAVWRVLCGTCSAGMFLEVLVWSSSWTWGASLTILLRLDTTTGLWRATLGWDSKAATWMLLSACKGCWAVWGGCKQGCLSTIAVTNGLNVTKPIKCYSRLQERRQLKHDLFFSLCVVNTCFSYSRALAGLPTACPLYNQLERTARYRKCDGHIFYTDHAAPGPQKDRGSTDMQASLGRHESSVPWSKGMALAAQEADFMRVIVPKQSVTRKDDGWLYHRSVLSFVFTNDLVTGGRQYLVLSYSPPWTLWFWPCCAVRNMVGLMPSWNHLLRGLAD